MHAWCFLLRPASGLARRPCPWWIGHRHTVTPFDRVRSGPMQCNATTGCRVISRHHDGLSPCPKCLEHAMNGKSGRSRIRCVRETCGCVLDTCAVFSCKNQNSKKNFRHLHGDLNLDETKNALRLLPVNRETNLMNLIRPQSDAKLLL